jgi:23S rRNA pseudouridine1911/1915/1917 synthase
VPPLPPTAAWTRRSGRTSRARGCGASIPAGIRIGPGAALVEACPETGRTHQIRIHLAHLGAPLLGDPRYGGPRRVGEIAVPRVMLHARALRIAHPVTGAPLALEAPVPEDFLAVERALCGEKP